MKLEEDLEGLLHVSELSDGKVGSVEDVLQPGMKIEVRVIRVDVDERKIGLSFVHGDFEENLKLQSRKAEKPKGAKQAGSESESEGEAGADAEGEPEST